MTRPRKKPTGKTGIELRSAALGTDALTTGLKRPFKDNTGQTRSAGRASSTAYSTRATALLAQWLRRPPRERRIRGSIPACAVLKFPEPSSHTSDSNVNTPVAALQEPGIVGSAPGLVGPVSVYCDWVIR